ncbi:MFS transporter [Nocardia vinacea]|uniref:MFS transporter n=1 Tax=Nocardia vinacea TaxID=96468 RepID=UPI0012F657F6|nr:MFS transporter [Nocardia vinacea]
MTDPTVSDTKRNFRLLWSGQTVSQLGSMVTTVALPVAAVSWLHGSTLDVGFIGMLQFLPALILTLPVGAWVDRRKKRPLVIAANIGQACAIGSIPITAAWGWLSIYQLYLVAPVIGMLSLISQLSSSSYIRTLVPKGSLQQANSRLQASGSAARVVGPGIGGVLISAFGAPFALAADAISFMISAGTLSVIRAEEPPESLARRDTTYLSSITEGMSLVYRDRQLRSIIICAAIANLCLSAIGTVEIPYLLNEMNVGSSAVGVIVAVGSVGGIIGAATAGWLSRKIGDGWSIWLGLAILGPFGVFLPLAWHGTGIAFFVLGLFFLECGITVSSVIAITFQQTYCPHDMLARVGASFRVLLMGTIPFGALLGGVAGSQFGDRNALWIFAMVNFIPGILWSLSGASRRRHLPSEPRSSMAGSHIASGEVAHGS